MAYRLAKNSVIRLADGATIPLDSRNRDYADYLTWTAAGNAAEPELAPSLSDVKAQAKSRIDQEAEVARLKYITAGAGQALEYRETAEEAARYVATNGAGSYPMLQASVNAGEAEDLAAAAAMIAQREAAWATIGATIREKRIAAKRAVSEATTVEQVQAAAQVAWP